MKVNHVIASLDASSGGPARSVPLVCEALAKYSEVELNTLESGDRVQTSNLFVVNAFEPSNPYLPLACSAALNTHLEESRCDLFNAHGLWLFSTHYAVTAARKLGKPIVITPRGMLEPGALQFSRWKKLISGWLWQNRDLHRATCIHVTSQMEADNCRKYGLKNPIAIVPNGIDLAEYPLKGALRADGLPQESAKKHKKRTLLFLSRIHGKKGLPFLLEAWAQLPQFHDEWQLVISGNDDGGHEAELKKLATDLKLNWSEVESSKHQVSSIEQSALHFAGPIFGESKIKAYQEADLFVLPTLSENFGMVVPEALACGTPVITTKGAPWQELPETHSGWWIDIGMDPLKECLQEALGCSAAELNEMGQRGRKLVEDNYSIDSVAKQMMQVYEWCLSKENPPEFLEVFSA